MGAEQVHGRVDDDFLATAEERPDRIDGAVLGVEERVTKASGNRIKAHVIWEPSNSDAFLTQPGPFTELVSAAVEDVTGRRPELNTGGGTSDARFITRYCPVLEFGLVGQTMHMVDERVALADLETLTAIYQRFLQDWFG